ncbi:MAG TPA: hypothetical protein PLN45_00380 [Exilispira sp.]|nr:hypothetical protein [Spirochaetota bacterium]NLJ05552.1 hypothetical protein [Exilispira sp.]HNV43251.1 hypothetical protein [Exilispira sp.]HOV45656.1 hypothetical protein [Exilispira sp.]HPO59979.1 hypothetical protein [Exilispira sp.]
MKVKKYRIKNFPEHIIEEIIKNTPDSYINIEDVKSCQYILETEEQSFGPFQWNDKFSENKIIDKQENKTFEQIKNNYEQNYYANRSFYSLNKDNFERIKIISSSFILILKDEILTSFYFDLNKNLSIKKKNVFKKSRYLYLLNISFKLNQAILAEEKEKITDYKNKFLNEVFDFIDFSKIEKMDSKYLFFFISDNIFSLPWEILSFYFAKFEKLIFFVHLSNNIAERFLVDENKMRNINLESEFLYENSKKILNNNEKYASIGFYLDSFIDKYSMIIESKSKSFIDYSKVVLCKDVDFQLPDNIWNNIEINKFVLTKVEQIYSLFGLCNIMILLAHGYRKKDFSSILINKKFLNPYSLKDNFDLPETIVSLSCLNHFAASDNNLIYNFFINGTDLFFGSNYIIPMSHVEKILKIFINKDNKSFFEKILEIYKDNSIDSLFRLTINSTKL